jgi:hypothetical protein
VEREGGWKAVGGLLLRQQISGVTSKRAAAVLDRDTFSLRQRSTSANISPG